MQAAKLRDELERRQTQLREYRQAIDDVRSLWKTTGGINLDEGDIAITPEVGTEILERPRERSANGDQRTGRLGPPPRYPAGHAAWAGRFLNAVDEGL